MTVTPASGADPIGLNAPGADPIDLSAPGADPIALTAPGTPSSGIVDLTSR